MFTTAIATITALLASTTFIITSSVVILIIMALLLERELEGWATTMFSLGIALILWNYGNEILDLLTTNPTATIGFTVSYIIVGVLWSFIKWRSHVKAIFDRAKEYKNKFVLKYGEVTDKNRRQFNDGIYTSFKCSYINETDTFETIANKISPIASEKKSTIISWISYWPISLIGTLANNPFRKLFEFIYSSLSTYYDKITNTYKKDAFGN